MFKNYLKIAGRHLLKNKGLSFINIFGLAIGMAFAILIGLWIQYETSFDRFHKNAERIGVIRKHTLFNNEKNTQLGIPLPLAYELKKYPEIKRVTKLDWGGNHSLVVGNDKFLKRGYYADPEFLKIFSFPVIAGNVETALNDPNAIVITRSLATTLFGKADPIGKTIKVDNSYNAHVSAVLEDIPKNSILNFEFLAPFEFKVQNIDWVKNARDRWSNNFLMNIVEIKEGVSMEALSKKIGPIMVQKDKENNKNQKLILQPFLKMHLYDEYKDWVNTGGLIEYVRLFGIIGIFVLLIACINFMNLSTARSEKRAKEVGIRKAVGSRRGQLIAQFLSESMLTAFVAFVVALGLIQILLPYLSDLGFQDVRFNFSSVSLLASVLLICIITGLIAGSYPALYLSSFMPVRVLKGIFRQGKAPVTFRKILVVSQFSISIGLIISTVIVFQQTEHARSRSLGYNSDNLITIGASTDLAKNYTALKQEVLNTGYVESFAKASSPMTAIYNSWDGFSWEGKDPNSNPLMNVVMTEFDYEKTVGLKFKEGRPFSPEYKTDSSAVIINEAAAKMIGFKDPIGKILKLENEPLTIIGIVENVVMEDPFKPVPPGIILFNKESISNFFIRLKKGVDLKKAIASIQPVFDKYNPSVPFGYHFVDEDFQRKFQMEEQVGKLAGIFAGLAIFISCLGLFGLAVYMAETRLKEIGIRKVLGASLTDLWILLSKEFVLLVFIACLIASPLAFWLMHNWLQKYDYRIDISWWIFVAAGMVAVIIALLTVSTQAIKAAVANPVGALRSE